MRYVLENKRFELVEPDSMVYAVSRSIHYGMFLAFEGIRFYCTRNDAGALEIRFLNWDSNLERFRRGISFNLGREQQHLVPTMEEIEDILIERFLKAPEMRDFINEMADLDAQGYLRPFTVDEDQSIGVTFPNKPSIRAVAARYDRYLGEPFKGVVIPDYVRACGANGTGCLSALLLDDRPHLPARERTITEWDTSCCLIALRDNTIIKIPESPLILPSVTINGIVTILRREGITVEERDVTYGELIERVRNDEVVSICSIGTAGILNRCDELLLIDDDHAAITTHRADRDHPLYQVLGDARTTYWDIYRKRVPTPEGMTLFTYEI
jgi:branched-subunit amino acid aminotransferase/4-amino-4-deoxychorismate lyase